MRSVSAPAVAFLLILSATAQQAAGGDRQGALLEVMTLNVWHGLRSGESKKRFPGEEAERKRRRFDLQIAEIRRLDPDVLLLQEVNPNQREARKYAAALGYNEIHKVTSCGLHLGPFYKIPRNVNEGLAILARPELGLRRLGSRRLSGNARCCASWGFQTRESRYSLFGEISVAGRKILLVTTHLSSPAFVLPDFEEELARLVRKELLTADQRDEILSARMTKERRNLAEVERMLKEIDRRRDGRSAGGGRSAVILGGDFNVEPTAPGIAAIRKAGYRAVGGGRELHTWDPVTNRLNYEIGTKRAEPLPTFDLPEVEALLAHRATTPRQIDHIFVSMDLVPISARRVLDRDHQGLFLSDHFAILATVELP